MASRDSSFNGHDRSAESNLGHEMNTQPNLTPNCIIIVVYFRPENVAADTTSVVEPAEEEETAANTTFVVEAVVEEEEGVGDRTFTISGTDADATWVKL